MIFGCDAACNPQGGATLFASRRPNGFLGYKDIDLQLSKDLKFYKSIGGFVRVDLLNLFNFKNYDPGSTFYDTSLPNGVQGTNYAALPQYNRATYFGVPFTVKLSGGLRF